MADILDMPMVTKSYVLSCATIAVLVQLDILSTFQLYFHPKLIWSKFEIWRLVTPFLYHGPINFSLFFNMVFTYKYFRSLEEGSFRGRTADFVMMVVFGAVVIMLSSLVYTQPFLSPAFTMMVIYVWARRQPYIMMDFFGLMFNAPYLPWVLLAFSFVFNGHVWVEVVGLMAGHLYYFVEDVFPARSGGIRLLRTPRLLKVLLDEPVEPQPPANPPGDGNPPDDGHINHLWGQ